MTATITPCQVSSSSDTSRSLAEDQRGAVMLTGLFMGCFLIGALWFIVGMGDAIVFRDKMQEAADVGAFSSAALHAKGMNFISLCNLVMLVGTVVHLVLGIISDVKFALMVACLMKSVCPTLPAKIASFEKAYLRWDKYFSTMSRAFRAIHNAQQVASYAYPAMGVAAAHQNGAKYGGDTRTGPVEVLAVSSSLLPGGALRGFGEALGGKGSAPVKKEGLPVEAKPFRDLCKKVITTNTKLLDFGKSMAGGALGGRALKIFKKLVGNDLEGRYCNKKDQHTQPFGPGFDGFWGEDGPYVVHESAANGNQWMQSWAINVSPKLNDTSESRVGFASKRFSKYTKQETTSGYFAQAEFYFDCDSTWSSASCNHASNATYAIKWRARLRRLELPAITSGAVGAGVDALFDLQGVKAFKDALPGKAENILGSTGLKQSELKGIVKGAVGKMEGYIKGELEKASEDVDPTLQGMGLTPYH